MTNEGPHHITGEKIAQIAQLRRRYLKKDPESPDLAGRMESI